MIPQHWARKLFPTARRLLVERDLRRLALGDLSRTLVVGAGYDPYRNLVQTAEYIRLDIQAYPGCTDVVGDALNLPFRRGSFDAVLAVEVMEHVPDPKRLVDQLYEVLAPGGAVVVTVPFMFQQHADPQDFWRPTRSALEMLFSGFQHVDIRDQGNRLCVMLDLLTTSFAARPVFFPFRVFNHLVVNFTTGTPSTSPSGFFVLARK